MYNEFNFIQSFSILFIFAFNNIKNFLLICNSVISMKFSNRYFKKLYTSFI